MTPEFRQQVEALIAEMQELGDRLAYQGEDALAIRVVRWADRLALLLAEAPLQDQDKKEDTDTRVEAMGNSKDNPTASENETTPATVTPNQVSHEVERAKMALWSVVGAEVGDPDYEDVSVGYLAEKAVARLKGTNANEGVSQATKATRQQRHASTSNRAHGQCSGEAASGDARGAAQRASASEARTGSDLPHQRVHRSVVVERGEGVAMNTTSGDGNGQDAEEQARLDADFASHSDRAVDEMATEASAALLETRGVPQEENEKDTRVVDSQYDPPSAGPLATAAPNKPIPTK